MNNTLTVSGNVTLVAAMTISGSSGLIINTTSTLTSNGKIWPNALTLNGVGGTIYTLADNLTVTGTLTMGTQNATQTINGNIIYAGGSMTLIGISGSGIVTGTTDIVLNGTGTWSNPNGINSLKNDLTINTAGTITISGTIYYNTGTLTYTAGTVLNTGASLVATGSLVLPSFLTTWDTITLNGTSGQYTIPTGYVVNDLNITGSASGPSYTVTLEGNITVNDDLAIGSQNVTQTINGYIIYVGGDLTVLGISGNGVVTGTTDIVLNGTGTWSNPTGYNSLRNDLTINTAGSITVSGTVYYDTGTFTYTSGTVTTTGSTLVIGGTSSTTL
jgi:hypothetical protein